MYIRIIENYFCERDENKQFKGLIVGIGSIVGSIAGGGVGGGVLLAVVGLIKKAMSK